MPQDYSMRGGSPEIVSQLQIGRDRLSKADGKSVLPKSELVRTVP